MTYKFFLSICFICLLLTCGCSSSINVNTDEKDKYQIYIPIEYDDGKLLYFGCTGTNFAKSYEYYMSTHNVTAISICGNGADVNKYGADTGYFVIVKQNL